MTVLNSRGTTLVYALDTVHELQEATWGATKTRRGAVEEITEVRDGGTSVTNELSLERNMIHDGGLVLHVVGGGV